MSAILITGVAGFIGSHLCRFLNNQHTKIIGVDNLSYPAHPKIVTDLQQETSVIFYPIDIKQQENLLSLLAEHQITTVFHLAAQTHVDRSIEDSNHFIEDNINGTHALLQACTAYYQQLNFTQQKKFRFLYISTDEVYGSLHAQQPLFTEEDRVQARNPYSASKAAAEQLVLAWFHTFNLPCMVTRCSNNFGPWQHVEKLIPRTILRAINYQAIELYGDGENIRDWLPVIDHVQALYHLSLYGKVGEIYNIAANHCLSNKNIVEYICTYLNQSVNTTFHFHDLISYVPDRLGHDFAYGMNSHKINHEYYWQAQTPFYSYLIQTIDWYIAHQADFVLTDLQRKGLVL